MHVDSNLKFSTGCTPNYFKKLKDEDERMKYFRDSDSVGQE